MKIKQLNTLATNMVGDGKKPNVFFVTKNGDVQFIATSFEEAYDTWRSITSQRPRVQSDLEDRLTGVICSQERIEDSYEWQVIDDSYTFGFRS